MNELFSIFEEIGLPYYRQGSLSDVNYPVSFFTFWEIDTPNQMYYDNSEKQFVNYIQVAFYTSNASLIYSQMQDFISRAKEHGFVIASRDRDTNADKANYFGRLVYIRKINNLEE